MEVELGLGLPSQDGARQTIAVILIVEDLCRHAAASMPCLLRMPRKACAALPAEEECAPSGHDCIVCLNRLAHAASRLRAALG